MLLEKKDKMRIVGRVYRHKIEIWDPSHEEENAIGELVQVPQKVCELWAEVLPVRGSEYIEMQKVVPQMQYKIVTRYRPGIHPAMIIRWRDKELNINAVINISGQDEHMEIICTEKVK